MPCRLVNMQSVSLSIPGSTGVSHESLRLLDDPQEWSSFSRLAGPGAASWESSVIIEGMHCAACALTLERALLAVPGVASAQVSAASHRARVVWSAERVQPSGWMQAIKKAGYQVLLRDDKQKQD